MDCIRATRGAAVSLRSARHTISQVGSFHGPQQTFTSQQSLKLTGRESAVDQHFRGLFHVTVNPQGVANITADRVSEVCR